MTSSPYNDQSVQNAYIYPYESACFHECWFRYLSPRFAIEKSFKDFFMHKKTMLKGCLRLNELRLSGWNNAWSQDLTRQRAMILNNLPKDFDWDYFAMIWAENRQSEQAFDMLKSLRLPVVQLPLTPEYVIDLTGGWEGYLKIISRNGRKNIRQKFARASYLKPELFFYEGPKGIENFFNYFFKLHINYWTNKQGESYLNNSCEQVFITAWARELQKTGHLVLDGVRLGDEVVNLGLSIIIGETRYMLLTINTGLYDDYFPGILGLHLRLQHSAASGIRTVNLGYGESAFKTGFSTGSVNRFLLLIPNPMSIKGKTYIAWLKHSSSKRRRDIF